MKKWTVEKIRRLIFYKYRRWWTGGGGCAGWSGSGLYHPVFCFFFSFSFQTAGSAFEHAKQSFHTSHNSRTLVSHRQQRARNCGMADGGKGPFKRGGCQPGVPAGTGRLRLRTTQAVMKMLQQRRRDLYCTVPCRFPSRRRPWPSVCLADSILAHEGGQRRFDGDTELTIGTVSTSRQHDDNADLSPRTASVSAWSI